MEEGSWLIRDGVERRRMLEMDRRLKPVRRQVFVVLAVFFALSSHWIGIWPLPVLAGAALLFELGEHLEKSVRKPEWVKFAVWACSELLIAGSLVVLGQIGTLCFLAVPMPTLASRFSGRGIILGAAVVLLLVVATAACIDVGAFTGTPEVVLAPAAVVISIAWFMKGGVMPDGLEIRRTSVRDPLTGLLNRSALLARVKELEAQSELVVGGSTGVIAVDVDGFKAINDQHGHPVGDAVLREVARRLGARLRPTDLFRSGGEEFVVLVPNADETQAVAIARDLCRAVHGLPCAGVEVTISCGVAASLPGGFDYERLSKEADDALYAAKRFGRNCVAAAGDAEGQPRDPEPAMNTSL